MLTKDQAGAYTALITLFDDNGQLDEAANARFIEWQIEMGTQGLVPVGTTGESPTMSHAEDERMMDIAVEVSNGRVPVIAGAGSNSTAEALSLSKYAQKAGADAAMVVTPYYNKPTQEGLYAHYATIAREVEIPIIIYNIPGRSVVDMTVETMQRLNDDFPHIVGVKDATAELGRPLSTKLALGKDFIQFGGEDPTIIGFLAQGGHGCISVTANIAPKLTRSLHDAWHKGDWERLETLRDGLYQLAVLVFGKGAPTPTIKFLLNQFYGFNESLRLPLVNISDDDKANLLLEVEALTKQIGPLT